MEGGTESLSELDRGRRSRSSSKRQPYDERDIAVIKACRATCRLSAALRRRRRPARPRAAAVARSPRRDAESAESCAGSPRSSTTAGPASRPTGWASEGSRRADPRDRPPDGGGSGESLTAISAPPMRTGPIRSSPWPTAARRRSATWCSTHRCPDGDLPSAPRCIPDRVRRSACSISPMTSRSGSSHA